MKTHFTAQGKTRHAIREVDELSNIISRSLAAEWESQFHGSLATYRTPLDSISLFVLLDLLGSPNPNIPSYFLTTHWAYKAMAGLEERMRQLGVLETKPKVNFMPESNKSANRFTRSYIDDDHRPFCTLFQRHSLMSGMR